MNDLIPLENPNPSSLFVPGGLDSIISRIESEARSVVPDIGTVKGRSAIASLAMKVAKAKTYLDGLGKDYTSELKRQTGAVDAERKFMRDRLDSLKAEIRRPLDEWEQAEIDRVSGINRRLDSLRLDLPNELTGEGYSNLIATIDAISVDDTFSEFRDEAQQIKDATLYRLCTYRDAAFSREAEAARIAKEVAEARAKEQQERDERIAKEAAEKATKEANARAERERESAARAYTQEIERARQAKEDAERREKQAESMAKAQAEIAERKRIADIDAERNRAKMAEVARANAERARKEDALNRERVHAEIVSDLEACYTDDCNILVEVIASGKIRHLTITY